MLFIYHHVKKLASDGVVGSSLSENSSSQRAASLPILQSRNCGKSPGWSNVECSLVFYTYIYRITTNAQHNTSVMAGHWGTRPSYCPSSQWITHGNRITRTELVQAQLLLLLAALVAYVLFLILPSILFSVLQRFFSFSRIASTCYFTGNAYCFGGSIIHQPEIWEEK